MSSTDSRSSTPRHPLVNWKNMAKVHHHRRRLGLILMRRVMASSVQKCLKVQLFRIHILHPFSYRAFTSFQPCPCHTSGITINVTLDKLLRLRKDLSTTLSVSVTQEAWERVIAPLFLPSEIVQQSLVRLESRVIHDLNTKLQHWEQDPAEDQNPRPIRRRGIYLANDEFGLLVTDMTAGT